MRVGTPCVERGPEVDMDKYEIWVSKDGTKRKLVPFNTPLDILVRELVDADGRAMRLVFVFDAETPDDALAIFHGSQDHQSE